MQNFFCKNFAICQCASYAVEEGNANQNIAIPEILPILPLKNTVLFPGVVIPISVGREKSIKALKEANENGKLLGVIAQNNESEEDPTIKTLYKKGQKKKSR